MQHVGKMFGIDAEHGFLLVDEAFFHHVAGDLERGLSGALAVSGLENEESAAFYGKLDILHVAVMRFQGFGYLAELIVDIRHFVGKAGDGLRRAHAGHHVFALGVHQEFAHKLLLARGGIAGEGHAAAGVVSHVAEHHGLDVHGRAEIVVNLVDGAVHDGAMVVPRAEHRLDGKQKLPVHVFGELAAHFLPVELLVALNDRFQGFHGKFLIERHALCGLLFRKNVLELFLRDFHDHVGEHLDEAAVGVIRKTRVVRELGETLDDLVVQAQVQNGVHHAGHGSARAGTDGNEQRVLRIGELLAADFLHLAQVLVDLRLDFIVDLAAILIVLGAGLRGNGEALGNRHAGLGHLSKVGALAAQELTHVLVAFREQVHKLVAHDNYLLKSFGSMSIIPNAKSAFIAHPVL